MRFAGDDIASFLGSGPNMSALTQKAALTDARETANNYNNVAHIGSAGASQLGATLAQGAVSEAQGNLAGAQAQAQMMGSIGKLGGSLIGGLGSMGGGSFGTFSGPSSAISGFSADDAMTMGYNASDAATLAGGGSLFWES